MAQRRPLPPPPEDLPPRSELHVSRDGWHYHVDSRAADSLSAALESSDSSGAAALSGLTDEVPVAEAWADIGWRGVQAAAADSGHPRSRSTIYAWTRGARLGRGGRRGGFPVARIAELVQRRAFVARSGGTEALAADLGVSASTVSRWQSGTTERMRGAAGLALDRARFHDAARRAGHPPIPIRGAFVRVSGEIEYRNAGDAYQEMGREHRNAGLNLDAPTAEDLAAALHAGDQGGATAIVEAAWTEEWGTFGGYSDAEGVHILGVDSFDVTWT